MDGATLQDRIDRGLGIAARAIGLRCDAYRCVNAVNPLASANRFLRLPAAFNPRDSGFRTAGVSSDPVWYGVLDGAYLRAGDYLVETRAAGRTWFVGDLQPLLPSLVVLTNTVVSVTRLGAGLRPGAGGYGGGGPWLTVLSGFPASLLHAAGSRGQAAIPADAREGGAVALLPVTAAGDFLRGDVLRDAMGRSFVVGLPERDTLGWRLELRQTAS